jgi:flavorubredoxin
MNDFLHHLKIKGYKNRKVAMIENGSWAPCAIKSMQPYFDEMKGIDISDAKVTIRSTMTAENEVQLVALADSII